MLKLCTLCMSWTVFDEPRFSLLVSTCRVWNEFVEGFAPLLLPSSELTPELLFSSFFVLRKRPPLPLALLMACRWRDSWRYGCKKWMKHLWSHDYREIWFLYIKNIYCTSIYIYIYIYMNYKRICFYTIVT